MTFSPFVFLGIAFKIGSHNVLNHFSEWNCPINELCQEVNIQRVLCFLLDKNKIWRLLECLIKKRRGKLFHSLTWGISVAIVIVSHCIDFCTYCCYFHFSWFVPSLFSTSLLLNAQLMFITFHVFWKFT